MSLTTVRIPLRYAEDIAAWFEDRFAPACERTQICGSIRRKKPDIGDIEILVVPRVTETGDGLFGDPVQTRPIDAVIAALVQEDRLKPVKGWHHGKDWKYAQFLIPHDGIKLDLFTANVESWGVQLAIRTGPADFSYRLVNPRIKDGYLLPYQRVKDGRLWYKDEPLETREEEQLFEALAMEFIKPEERK